MIRVIGNRGILGIIAVFVAVMIAGTFMAAAAVNTGNRSVFYNTLSAPLFTDFSYFLDVTIVLILALLILRRHSRHGNGLLFVALEGVVTSFTSFFALLLFFVVFVPQSASGGLAYAYAATVAIVLILFKERFPRLRDLTTAVSSVGVGLVLGFNFPFWYAILLFGAIAIYDYVAVFKTSEMAALANAVSANNLSFLISVSDLESVPRQGISDREVSSYMKYLSDARELDDPRFKRILKSGRLPVMSQVSLGEGDLCLPLMAAVSAYASFGSAMAGVVLLGAAMGIVATMAMLKMYKHPIPAIPPLFAFVGLAAGVAILGSGGGETYNVLSAALVLACSLVLFVDIVTIARRMRRERAAAYSGRGRRRRGRSS